MNNIAFNFNTLEDLAEVLLPAIDKKIEATFMRIRDDLNKKTVVMTLKESAKYLQVSVPTVRKIIDQGKLKVSRIGTRILIRKSDLDAYLDASQESGL